MNKDPLNIMIVVSELTCGGTERAAAELANYLFRRGAKVKILLMYYKEKFYHINPDIKIIEPSITEKKIGKIFYIPFLLFFLRSQFIKHKPEIILAFGNNAFTLFSSIGLKAKVIMSFRSSPTRIRFPRNKALNFTYGLAHSLMKRRVDGIIAQTKKAADILKNKYSCPIIVIPNFLRELKEYNHKRSNKIITVGRCSYEKGQHFLIEAFSKLNAPDWILLIVGDGPRRIELEAMVNNLAIKERVIFTGYQKDVDYYLSQSKIFALTSMVEGFPNALLEAMANSLAPVSFNCDTGPAEIIQHGKNGFLVEVGDVDRLAQYLFKLISNEELRISIASEAFKAKSLYSLDNMAERYLNFFLLIQNKI